MNFQDTSFVKLIEMLIHYDRVNAVDAAFAREELHRRFPVVAPPPQVLGDVAHHQWLLSLTSGTPIEVFHTLRQAWIPAIFKRLDAVQDSPFIETEPLEDRCCWWNRSNVRPVASPTPLPYSLLDELQAVRDENARLKSKLARSGCTIDTLREEVASFCSELAATNVAAARTEEDAKQQLRNAEFYRKIVTETGDALGIATRTADDGTVYDSVVALKVPEVAADLREKLEAAASVLHRFPARQQDTGLVQALRALLA